MDVMAALRNLLRVAALARSRLSLDAGETLSALNVLIVVLEDYFDQGDEED
jgi:hypothetical protein